MAHALINTFRTNVSLKLFSLILGYFFWAIFSQSRVITISLDVPLSFYNVAERIKIDAPEAVKVTLHGKRIYFDALDISDLAFHINAHTFKKGKRPLRISNNQLFLPDGITLVNYKPSPLVIQINIEQLKGAQQA